MVGAVVFGVGNACGRIYRVAPSSTAPSIRPARSATRSTSSSKQLNTVADTINASKETQQGQPDFEMTEGARRARSEEAGHAEALPHQLLHLEASPSSGSSTITITPSALRRAHAARQEDRGRQGGDRELHEERRRQGRQELRRHHRGHRRACRWRHFVELGSPVCPQPDQTDCPPATLKGFKYRIDSGGAWGERPIKGKPGEIVMPMQPSAALQDRRRRQPGHPRLQGLPAPRGHHQAAGRQPRRRAEGSARRSEERAERPKVFTF